MCKKKRLTIVVVSLVVTLLLLFSIKRYVYINSLYPQREYYCYSTGEKIEYLDYSFDIAEIEYLDYWDFKEKYQFKDTYGFEDTVDENKKKVLLVHMNIENTSDSSTPMPFVGYFTLQTTTGYSDNMDMFIFEPYYMYTVGVEDINSLFSDLHPHERRELILPYSIDTAWLSYDHQIDDYILELCGYPQKIYYQF